MTQLAILHLLKVCAIFRRCDSPTFCNRAISSISIIGNSFCKFSYFKIINEKYCVMLYQYFPKYIGQGHYRYLLGMPDFALEI